MKKTNLRLVGEELLDYVAENTGLGYTVAGNFILQTILDFGKMLSAKAIRLFLLDESGTLRRSGRQTSQERSFRFVSKGSHAEEALTRARELAEWLEDKRSFETPTYRLWILRFPSLPGILVRGENETHLADFVVTLLAITKV